MASLDTRALPTAPQDQPYQQDQFYDQYSQQPPQQPQQSYQRQEYPNAEQPQAQSSSSRPPITKHSRSKSRTFSFHSDKSGSKKAELHETHREKEAKRLHSKADPTLAMNEAEPAVVQANQKTSLMPLRSIQHKDPFGNLISDPDRSNPTRSRWERPLDTIRNFEAAIDGNSRRSYIRPDAETWNRRNSYVNTSNGGNGQRYEPSQLSRPPSQFDVRSHRDSYYEGQGQNYTHGGGYGGGYGGGHGSGHGGGNGYYNAGPNRSRARLYPDSQQNPGGRGDPGVYPLQHKDRSYETVTSAGASGSSGDHNSYHTDPSSDNGSLDRSSPAKRSPVTNDYGIGFNQASSYQPAAFSVGQNPNGGYPNNSAPQNGFSGPSPAVPQKDQSTVIRKPTIQQQETVPQQDKRKSWFTRRFSKN